MDANTAIELLQKGFRVTLGATTSLVESLQDEQKRQENLAQLRLDFNELTQVWAAKGEVTEAEARNFVESMLAHTGSTTTSATPATDSTASVSTLEVTTANANLQLELQELIAQLAAIRTELAEQRQGPAL